MSSAAAPQPLSSHGAVEPQAAQPPEAPNNCSFLLPGPSSSCLLLHGFTAAPQEMRFLAEQLNVHGYNVSGVQLAGHGTSVDDLARSTWNDWYASARYGLAALSAEIRPVTIIGQSMGALLALLLAAEHRTEVSGVVLLSPALRLSRRWLEWARPLLVRFGRGRSVGKDAGDIADTAALQERQAYRRVPLSALCELLDLQQQARRRLAEVHQPALVIHSRQDHTCSIDGVRMIEEGLSGLVRTLILEDSYHVVSVDVEKDRVAAAVATFVADTSPVPPPPH